MLDLCQQIIEYEEEMNDRAFINALFMLLPELIEWGSLQNSLYRKEKSLNLNEVMTGLNV